MRNTELKHAKPWALAVLTILILGAGAFATTASAQNARVFEVEVPFDFVVNGRTYPADTYRIGRLNQANPNTLVLNTSNGKTLSIFQTQRHNSEAPAESSKLTFSQFGETYFLNSVTASGESYVSRLPSNKSDRRQSDTRLASRTVSIVVK